MKIEIHAEPVFFVPLSLAHVNLLMKLADTHYDHVCRSAAMVGGFLHGWHTRLTILASLEDGGDPGPCQANFGDLDLCLKIMENTLYQPLDKAAAAMINDMRRSFKGALRLANEKQGEWTDTYEKA